MIYRTLKRRIIKNGMVFLSVLSILFAVSLSMNISATRAQAEAPNFRNVVLFATNSIELKEGSVIQSGGSRSVGDIVINSAGPRSATELKVGVRVSTSAGTNLFADSIEIQNRAKVAGDVFYNDLKNKGNISGNLNTPLNLPVFEEADIPPFVYGTPDDDNSVSVKQAQSLTITPGDYGDINIKKGGVLILDGAGIYNARSIKAGPNTSILIDAADDVQVRVAEDFTAGQTSTVGSVSGSGIDASKIIFYVAGDRPGGKGTPIADFGEQSVLDASIYVNDGRLALRNGTSARGSFFATDIDIGSGTTVTFNGFFGNEPPVAGDDSYSIEEDTALLENVLDNDTDADGDPLTAVLDTGPVHGVLSLDSNGTFTYTPDANYNGLDSFTYRASDGTSLSNVATVSIEISPVADAPVAVDDFYEVNEDSSISITAPGILANDTDADNDPLTTSHVSGPDNGSLTLNPDGSFGYTPDADFNGSDSFAYKVSDGVLESNEATVTINVNPVNDAPVAADDSYDVDEDGVLTVSAPGVLSNDTDIDGDTLTAILDTDPVHGVLVLNGDGSFTYTPELGFYGSDSFTYVANDGTVDSNVATATITIKEVNDAPVAEDDGYLTDEDSTLTVAPPGVLINDYDNEGDPIAVDEVEGDAANVGIQFALASGALLTLNSDGSFNYETNGQFEYLGVGEETTDSFVYRINDGKGGTDTATVTVTINGINDAPTAADKNISATGNVRISVTDGDDDLLFGVTDPDTGNTHTITACDTTSTNGGTVTLLDASAGTFSYNPPPGFEGSDSFGFTVSDNNGGTDTGTVSCTVDGMIFFINGSASPGGDGRLTSPFDTLAAFEAVNGNGGAANPEAGDIIFLYTGSYSGGVTLENDQTLVGQGATDTLENIAGITLATYSNPLPSTGGVRPDITNSSGNVISLAGNNTIRGLNIVNTASSKGINGTSTGTLTINEMIISGTGDAAYINGGTLDVTLDSLEVSGGTSTGINLANVSGDFTVTGSTTITGNSGISVTGSPTMTCDFSGGINITSTLGDGLVANNAGTLRIGGLANIINTDSSTALKIQNTTIGSGGLTFYSISAGTGVPSPGTGIILDNTGTEGGLTVTGDGTTPGSGGTIQNKTGSDGTDNGIGIRLNQTQDTSLSFMQLNNFDNFAIRGTGVTDFTLANSTVGGSNGNSAAADEGSISFNNLLGSAAFSDCNIEGGYEDNIVVMNNTGTLDRMTVTNGTIGLNSTSGGNDGILVEAQGTAVVNLTVSNMTFLGARGDLIQTNALGTSTMDVVIRDNDFQNTHPSSLGGGVTISGGSATSNINLTYDISGTTPNSQTFRDSVTNAITVNILNGAGNATGTINNNKIGVTGISGSGSSAGSGISIGASGTVTHRVTINSNDIDGVDGFAGIDVNASNGAPSVSAIITNNIMDEFGGFVLAGIYTMSGGAGPSDTASVCADIRFNTINAGAVFGYDYFIDQISPSNSTYNFPGYAGPSTPGLSPNALDVFLAGQNTLLGGSFYSSFAVNVTGNPCP